MSWVRAWALQVSAAFGRSKKVAHDYAAWQVCTCGVGELIDLLWSVDGWGSEAERRQCQ